MKRAAFVMVNHNGGAETAASVASLLAELTDDDALILVDNGSHDGSGEAAAKLGRVVYLPHNNNLPFAEATNIGIRWALERGYTYIGPINPDVRARPGFVETLIARLERRTDTPVGAVTPVMPYDDPDDRIWYAGGRVIYPISWTMHSHRRTPLRELPKQAWDTQSLTGCCWLSPASVWNEIGLLDPSYGMYAEDVDWSTRLWRAELRMIVEPAAVLVHRVSTSSGGGRSPFKMVYRTLATRLYFHRWTPPCLRPLRALLTPPFVAFYASFLYLAEGRNTAIAYLRAWRTKRRNPVPWPPSPHLIGK